MKPIEFSRHAIDRLSARGIVREEVEETINEGERVSAKHGRVAFRKNFPFEDMWKDRYYETKQVQAIVVEEEDRLLVVTVFAFYFGGVP